MIFRFISKILLSLLLFAHIILFAQDIPIGTWRDHLPYKEAISVTYGDNIVYCATSSAVFTYNKIDNSVEKLTLVNGLSDIGLSKIKFNPFNKKIVIAYENGNIDVLDNNKRITNISFIKTGNVVGDKSINHIYFQNQFAYISTGFGIVVLNTEKLEIKETYFFGPGGISMETKAVTFDPTNIYAATNQGVYFANRNSANLADFNSWSLLTDLGTFSYSGIVYFSGRVFASLDSPSNLGDTVFFNNNNLWQKFLPNGFNIDNIEIDVQNNFLFIDYALSIDVYNSSLSLKENITAPNSQEIVSDEEQTYWIADNFGGLFKKIINGDSEFIFPNGPSSSSSFSIDIIDEDVWMVSGGTEASFAPTFNTVNLINYRINDRWESSPRQIFDINNGNVAYDALTVAINPTNKNQAFVGMWDRGLFEFNDGNITNVFTAQNSALDSVSFGPTKIAAVAFDKNNNLWVANSFANNSLTVKTPNNEWYSFSLSNTNLGMVISDIVFDNNNYKWVISPNTNKIGVFDDNNTLDNENDDRAKILIPSVANPDLQSLVLLSIAEDLDGEIWIGTSEGVAVFFSPSQVFDETIKAEQVFIQQDGNTEILLGTEVINTIAIDGANRKWFGTQNSGAFLMDESGTEQILHFSTDNSPLFSNNILDIDINDITGEVFFATAKGLISYKGDATEVNDDFSNVFVYPNPVKPSYNGVIAIRGLVKNTDVKITDVSGNIVFETKSLGGQAIWDGKNLFGKRVQTGVYMVFSGSEEGDQKHAAKILFIN
jgi:TSS9, PorZ, N-terminal beta-propeller domain